MLTIDIGNSRIKWARFQDGKIVNHHVQAYSADSFEADLSLADLPSDEHPLVISHVAGGSLKKSLIRVLDERGFKSACFAQTQTQQGGVSNAYAMPDNLGVDRWLAMIAAFQSPLRKQGEAVCVIDCGTATTLDVVDAQGKHLGGMIMPGLQTMYESLVSSASRIQMDKKSEPGVLLNSDLASSTERAVKQGCQQMMLEGLSGIVTEQKQRIKGLMQCLVTGGDGEWVSGALKHQNTYEPFLVHYGLHLLADEIPCVQLDNLTE